MFIISEECFENLCGVIVALGLKIPGLKSPTSHGDSIGLEIALELGSP